MPDIWPALPLLVGALLAGFARGHVRAIVMLAAPILGALNVYHLDSGTHTQLAFLGQWLTPVRVDSLSLLFGYLFHLAALIGVIYALHLRDRLQQVAALAYAASAVGAVFAGDLLTLFVYWELLAITSAVLVFARRSDASLGAGIRYLVMQIGSGVLLLAGAILYARSTGSLAFDHIGIDAPGGWLIFIAFGIKCAFPMLHGWLTDAYPEATPTGTVFLSAFTTKVAVYALARGFAGTELLIGIGALMTCFPIFYAVIENDLRRVLAYSLINQLGFMVVGIGIGTELALNGAVAHAFNDVIFKGLLMMSMGAVLHVTGEMRGSELGGLYKKMPKTALLCMVGAASISAFPLFSGFVSKSMVVSAALQEGHSVVWLALLFASAGVFHHAGIKIPFFAFFAHDSKYVATAHEPPVNMLIAMAIAAVLCVGIGSFPAYLYALLPYDTGYSPYDVSHVLAQLQLLAFSALAFTWLKLAQIYPPELRSVNLDVDWLYRRLMPDTISATLARLAPLDRRLRNQGTMVVQAGLQGVARHHGRYGVLAGSWPTGSMVIWVAALLGLSLLLYYV
ncbi:MAG: Na(+)/H(+) antiporter subunit D [Gammaproteobacteria bacterium]|nr:Na(+)/H(+) antiporter subunit D [Gammaproteobacteria bacterium]MCB1923318.1 Na(+)/H(+) antiporter subunit D [Gammaproteobacteria bacterium]